VGLTAKGLVLDLLSTVRKGSMPVRALVAAGALFRIDENHVRVTLARLLAEGRIERDERGAYRPGPASRTTLSLVTAWRRTEERMVRWNGDWLAVLTGATARSARGAVRDNERALALLGFEPLERGLALRPANLAGGVDHVRGRLTELGLDASAIVVAMSDLDATTDERARSLWNAEAIEKQYDRTIERLELSRRRLAELPEARAMSESFTIGGAAIRQIVRDPLLPPPLVAAGALAKLVRAARSYDEAGRACWRPFLQRHGVDFARAPVQLAGGEMAMHVAGGAQ
jgi:phenylacetic acid degradation operon negative regulatory protein